MPWGLCDDAGRNNISSFDNVMYLRQFKKLRLVNLAGNPIAGAADYRSYVLSHIKDLTYLDYRRVNAADVAAAMDQHQVSVSSLRWGNCLNKCMDTLPTCMCTGIVTGQ